MPQLRSLMHYLQRAQPGYAGFIEEQVIPMLRDLAADKPIRLDDAMYFGSAAYDADDADDPWREDTELLFEYLHWLLGAIVLSERGELHARYQVRNQGTKDESAAIVFSAATPRPEAKP